MGAWTRSWWKKVRKPLEIAVLIVGCILVIALLVVIVLVYVFNVDVPGLHEKTLWD
jgi:TRAP-type C4-dicarboxylate transport system permease small subunit